MIGNGTAINWAPPAQHSIIFNIFAATHSIMKEPRHDILALTEAHIVTFFSKNMGDQYVFHDLQHTRNVVEAIKVLGAGAELSEKQLEYLQIAAWFHDTGYSEGADGHEERSCQYAREFLEEQGYPDKGLEVITRCIMATRLPFQPEDQLEEIMCDADLSHLGKMIYWERCGRLRQELLTTKQILMSDKDWVKFEIDFMSAHHYFTKTARDLYDKQKRKHIKQLKKQQLRLHAYDDKRVEDLQPDGKKKKKKKKQAAGDLKEFDLGRGVETMYRTTYRTHINLSSIADNKANIMLSINAIVISIVLPQLLPMFSELPMLRIPTFMLIGVCVSAIVLATLSTRPKITEGKFTREDIETRKANLLFFGNFYEMPLKDYHWGMMEMIKDSEFLYSSMTKDLYFLGVVLAKKYRYLSYCYGVFMYGMILSVLAFAIAFLF